MATIIQSITELPVDQIEMGDRLRPVSKAGVEAIKASVGVLGVIKDAIHVRKIKRNDKIVLIAGGHRLTAARELEHPTIKVVCWDCNDDFARLMEIDDNLAGAELTPLDTAVFLAERKRVYHPSLLPRFKGRNAIADALASGVAFTGGTVYHLTRDLDGGAVVRGKRGALQGHVQIIWGETPAQIWRRALLPLGLDLLTEAVEALEGA